MENQKLSFLEQPQTRNIIKELAQSKLGGTEEFKLIKKLRHDFTSEETSWLLNQVKLRQKALRKFPSAMVEKMYFEEKALEQATSWPLALHRAQKLQSVAPEGPILDLGCGIVTLHGIVVGTLPIGEVSCHITVFMVFALVVEVAQNQCHATVRVIIDAVMKS